MKEKIYTIPINEAMEKDGECPLCIIESRLDEGATDYFLGAAMMECDVRILTNERGFCRGHFAKMLGKKSVLPLALMLQSRLSYVQEKIEKCAPARKKKLFGKDQGTCYEELSGLTESCAACERVEGQMRACVGNFAYMVVRDEEFRKKFFSSKGVCVKHYAALLPALECEGAGSEIIAETKRLETENLARLAEEIDYFTKKFDYRNQDAPWNGTEDSPERCCNKLSGEV